MRDIRSCTRRLIGRAESWYGMPDARAGDDRTWDPGAAVDAAIAAGAATATAASAISRRIIFVLRRSARRGLRHADRGSGGREPRCGAILRGPVSPVSVAQTMHTPL